MCSQIYSQDALEPNTTCETQCNDAELSPLLKPLWNAIGCNGGDYPLLITQRPQGASRLCHVEWADCFGFAQTLVDRCVEHGACLRDGAAPVIVMTLLM